MATTEAKGLAQDLNQMCWKCGASRRMRRQPRSLFDRILSLQRFRCEHCIGLRTSFRLDWTTPVRVLLLCALAAGAVMARKQPDWFRLSTGNPRFGPDSSIEASNKVSSQTIAFDQTMKRRPRATLDNAAILRLWHAGVEADVIVQMIRTSNADYDTSANAIIELREGRVDRMVILAMIDTSFLPFKY